LTVAFVQKVLRAALGLAEEGDKKIDQRTENKYVDVESRALVRDSMDSRMLVKRNRDERERRSSMTEGEMQPFQCLQEEVARRSIVPDCSQEADQKEVHTNVDIAVVDQRAGQLVHRGLRHNTEVAGSEKDPGRLTEEPAVLDPTEVGTDCPIEQTCW
jgi:hypothetical protein